MFLPLKVEYKDVSFHLLAVWNFYHACKQGRFKDVKGGKALEYEALKHYQNILKDPCLIAGDWNLGPTFSQDTYFKILDILSQSNIHCLYHKFHNLSKEDVSYETFKPNKGNKNHILDHILGSKLFGENIKDFKIGSLKEAVLSDHAPLILELDFRK